jgi:hypothetical protein
MAAPAAAKLRRREAAALPQELLSYASNTSFYSNACSWTAADGSGYPFCYGIDATNIAANPEGWKGFFERVYYLRQQELNYLVANLPPFLASSPKLFLMGHGEGAMAASRYYNPQLETRLAGRIISGWTCEYNFLVGCAANARICGDLCRKDTPILNIIGSQDTLYSSLPTSRSVSTNPSSIAVMYWLVAQVLLKCIG